jgi:hypothetical protein
MQRRDVLAIGGLAGLVGGLAPALGTAAEASPAGTRLLRVWSDDAGQSHLEELTIAPKTAPLAQMAVRFRRVSAADEAANNWHNPPGRSFVVNLEGDLDCEVTDGAKSYVPVGGIVFLEDTKGKGHITRPRRSLSLMFLVPPPEFDVVAWAKGV